MWRMADELRDKVPILTLTEEQRRLVVSHMAIRDFDRGEVVYHLSDPGQDLFVVHSGLVMSWLEDELDHRALLGWFGRGQFIGEFELIRPGRLHTVTAVEPTVALQIRHADALEALRQNVDALFWMLGRMHELHRRQRDALFLLAFGTPEARVADVLLEAEELYERETHRLTQPQLAAAAFVSERYLRTLIANLAGRGLIDSSSRHVRVVDRARLRAEVVLPRSPAPVDEPPHRLGDVEERYS